MATSTSLEPRFVDAIAKEVGCRGRQVQAAADLFNEGSTVPFVARYRKEATEGLEDLQLEVIAKRREYFLELTVRRDAILESVAEQGKLTPELEKAIRGADTKQLLEDLYLPYKRKRRTRAQIARERGLEPMAEALLAGTGKREAQPEELAAAFVSEDLQVADAEAALAGARDILAERLAENAGHRAGLRQRFQREGQLRVRVVTGKDSEEGARVYQDYFDYSEPVKAVASHRLLAVLRGEREGFLLSDLDCNDEAATAELATSWKLDLSTPCGEQLRAATADGYKRLLRPSIANEVRGELRSRAEAEAIRVFRDNLEALLMQSPVGQIPVMGLDPGYRTGCKLAVVDGTGRVAHTSVIFPIQPRADEARARKEILDGVQAHGVHAVAIGNGTGSRETEAFVRGVVKDAGHDKVIVAIVPETGASVYSASAVARDELPDLDVSLRGAVSIARRLQDPLAELVKIEPRSLGVGQYQHDVDQKRLSGELDLAVEGTVNRVGVEVNTASAALLRRVSGLSERLARSVVGFRDENGPFGSRKGLLGVPGFGPKTFELAGGFLRVRDGEHPLDRTAVHPERYGVVEGMAKKLDVALGDLLGNPALVGKLDFGAFANRQAGLGAYTLEDIRRELELPGRDPRPSFEVPKWRDDVQKLEDLEEGMVLEGRVSNVANFGAFVDIGVKRDGLIHLSELSTEWVEDPRQVVKVGQIVKARVIEVDRQRGRISLSIKQLHEAPPKAPGGAGKGAGKSGGAPTKRRPGGAGASGGPGQGRGGRGKNTRKTGAAPPTVEDLMRKFNRGGA